MDKLKKLLNRISKASPILPQGMCTIEVFPEGPNGMGTSWLLIVPCEIADNWNEGSPELILPIRCPGDDEGAEPTVVIPIDYNQVHHTEGYFHCMTDPKFLEKLCLLWKFTEGLHESGDTEAANVFINFTQNLIDLQIQKCARPVWDITPNIPEGTRLAKKDSLDQETV